MSTVDALFFSFVTLVITSSVMQAYIVNHIAYNKPELYARLGKPPALLGFSGILRFSYGFIMNFQFIKETNDSFLVSVCAVLCALLYVEHIVFVLFFVFM